MGLLERFVFCSTGPSAHLSAVLQALLAALSGVSGDVWFGAVHHCTMRFSFDPVALTPALEGLRQEVRAFLNAQCACGGFQPEPDAWTNCADLGFSKALGRAGYIGMTWPKRYGGQGRSTLERYVVMEELLAAGAPVAAHWIADRQSGAQLLRHGSEDQKRLLPHIAAGEAFVAIGMSEPGAGSDLANISTRAEKTPDGWRLNGRKIWSSGAHLAQAMIALVRTAPRDLELRHAGLSQMLIDLQLPGITISPITDMAGGAHFNEVLFEDVMLPENAILGTEGGGWRQVTGELALERSGPERFMSNIVLYHALLSALGRSDTAAAIGALDARLSVLRGMSMSIAARIEAGDDPALEAALVKELGQAFEADVLTAALDHGADIEAGNVFWSLLHMAQLRAPAGPLRGGTREIMRSIIARGLGVR